jgi:uncharacterized protein (DUF697 family)
MPNGTLSHIWKAIRQLNPGSAARESERPFSLAIVGASEDEVSEIRRFLLGPNPTQREITCSLQYVKGYIAPLDKAAQTDVSRADLVLATALAATGTDSAIIFAPQSPGQSVRDTLDTSRGADLRLALGSCFPPFRNEVARRIVREVSKENAIFVIATALGDVVPSIFEPLLGLTEAASDTAFLTANQVRMLFVVGAAYGEPVGYTAQWREVMSIVGAAFGWRAIARELVSKIPFGGGLVPKGAIAYAGTTAVGEGLIFYYTTGRRMTREEMKQTFQRVYSDGLESVRSLVGKLGAGKAGALGKGSGVDTD